MKKLVCFLVLALTVLLVSVGAYAETMCEEKDGKTVLSIVEKEVDLLGASKLATPKNLKWNPDGHNGSIQWGAVSGCEGEYHIEVFCGSECIFSTNWSGLYDHDGDGLVGVDVVFDDTFNKSGKYTFKVKAIGDGKKYSDSDTATSGVYNFTLPSKKLSAPRIIRWDDDGFIVHTAIENAGGYEYKIYNQHKEEIGNISFSDWEPVTDLADVCTELGEELLWYAEDYEDIEAFYIKVVALTYDIEKYRNSDESGFSPRISVSGAGGGAGGGSGTESPKDLGDLLEDAWSGKISAEQAVSDFISGMEESGTSAWELAMNMQQDPELAGQIAQLEAILSAETGMGTCYQDKSDEGYLGTKGIALDEITVVGALLNSEDGKDVTVTFDKPDPSYSADELFYKNSVGVEISMEGVKDAQKLDVPVQIKLPVPVGVVPDRLVIIHYHADGSSEEIRPEIITEYGRSYAKFILTSFSTFIFCNEEEATITVNVNSQQSVQLSGGLAGSVVMAALYDSNNAMLGAKVLEPEAEVDVQFPDAKAGDYVKLMWLDGRSSLAPVCESEVITIR